MTLKDVEQGWKPPDGMGYSGMRPVKLTAAGFVLAVMTAVFAIGGPVLGVTLWNRSNTESSARTRLDREGVAAQAAIDRLWHVGGESPTDHVSYHFEAGATPVTGSSQSPSSIWRTLHVGETLPVRYVAGDPTINHPTGWPMNVTPEWLAYLVGTIVLGDAGLMLWIVWRQWHLLGEGRPTPGLVLKARRTGRRVMVRYEFRALSGALVKGRCSTNSGAVAGEGSAITVLYDLENPKRNAPYPFQLVRLEGARDRR
jgi:hypothetical protein